MINWDFFVKKDSRHSHFQTPIFSCFYYCLHERVGDEDGITYDKFCSYFCIPNNNYRDTNAH